MSEYHLADPSSFTEYIMEYISQISFLFYIKLGIVAVLTFLTDVLDASVFSMGIYFFILCLDFVTAIILDVSNRSFKVKRLGIWLWKVVIQCCIAVLIGAVFHMMFLFTGFKVPVINGMLFLFALIDLTNVIVRLNVMGFELHPAIHFFLRLLRKKTITQLNHLLDDKENRRLLHEELKKRRDHDNFD